MSDPIKLTDDQLEVLSGQERKKYKQHVQRLINEDDWLNDAVRQLDSFELPFETYKVKLDTRVLLTL
eukprot:8148-Heterococcus_DN1.PRE.4